MKILLTGFQPFGGDSINPSMMIVEAINNEWDDVELHKLILPVSFSESKRIIEEQLDAIRPDIVLSIGQRGGCCEINVERIAINLNDATKPDNDGDTPCERKIYEEGENAYFASIPTKKIVRDIKENGIPAVLSNSAGLYVCNNVMYTTLHYIKSHQLTSIAGFIHVPYLPQQAALKEKKSSMALQDMIKAVKCAIESIKEEIQPQNKSISIT